MYMYVPVRRQTGLGGGEQDESRILDLLRGSMIYNGNAWFEVHAEIDWARVCDEVHWSGQGFWWA